MATTVARLEAYLSANTRDFDQSVDRSEHRFSKMGAVVKKVALGAGLAIGAGLGVAAKIGFDEFKQGALVTAQTNAVIKSTGGTAKVTAKQVDALATSLMKKSGVDDEVIKSGENMLLTFKNIRNEAGKGNDIFNQSTKTLIDMATAMGSDPKKAAIQLGKALNDPIKGITALTKVGVTFSEGQKATIKAMVEAGDTMGAQKIILKELNSEFGGSAEAAGKTLPGQLNILKETFSNTAGEIVGKFVPTLVTIATVVGPLILRALDAIGKLIDEFVSPAFKRVGDVASENWPKIQEIASRVFSWIKANVFPIVLALKQIWVDAMGKIRDVLAKNGPELQRIFGRLGEAIKAIAVVAVPILRVAFVEVLPRVLGIVIKAIDLVTAAIEGVIKAIRWVGEKAGPLVIGFKNAIMEPVHKMQGAFDLLVTALGKVKDVLEWIIDHAGKLKDIFGDIAGGAKSLAGKVNPFGDADPNKWLEMGREFGSASVAGVSPHLNDEIAGGLHYGLRVTSGLRPGARTKHGTLSDHATGHAVDMAGSASGMAAFFRWLIGQADVKQAFYDPLGSIFNGALSSYREGGHSDHVHVASYDRGGFLQPGWNLAYNGLGRPEPVGAGNVTFNFPNYVGSKSELMTWVQNASQQFKRRNGRSPF